MELILSPIVKIKVIEIPVHSRPLKALPKYLPIFFLNSYSCWTIFLFGSSYTSFLIVLFLSAAIAAIMSTVDSALLAISSLVTNDIYGRYKPEAPQSVLTKMGKIASWGIMAVAVYMAIVLPQTIWRIMEIKLELLCQIAPSIFLGLHYKNLKGNAVFAGAAAGTVIAVGIMMINYLVPSFPVKPWGIHAGIWGLMVNVSVLIFVQNQNYQK